MFQSETKLSHVLAPEAYWKPEVHRREVGSVFRNAWHFVGTTPELARPGDFLTCELAQTPVHVRNFDGKLVALSNVCAHRHALISSKPHGNAARMKCQYHGWEYQQDGRTGKIPQPRNFVPFDQEPTCLRRFALESVGQLVFVNVSENPRPLRETFDDELWQLLEARFGDKWTLALSWQPTYPANWKVPIENSLESYHVPNVHPTTFREDPGGDRSDHLLRPNRTAMTTQLPFSPHNKLDAMFQRLESIFVRWLGHEPTAQYWQHHVFPNILFSFTDAISLVNCVSPDGPQTCKAIVRQFCRSGGRNGALKSFVARTWGKLTAALTKRILEEDQHIFAPIQAGLERSHQEGVLGICEERIYHFQRYIQKSMCPSCSAQETGSDD